MRMPRDASPAPTAAHAIHSAAIHLLRSLRRQDARQGVGPAGLSVLSVLVFGRGPRTMAQLADIEQVKRPTMTRIVSTLENCRLVERRRGGADRRTIVVQPTSRGRTVMLRARADRIAVLEQRMARLTEAEITTLVRAATLLERISKGEAFA